MNRQGVFPAPFGFAGEWRDSTTGLQYLRARWYDPATGRFTQVDPFPGVLRLPGTQHPYVYALNNPLRYTDPSGEFAQILGGAAVGAAIGAAAGGVSHALRNPGKSLGEYIRDAEFRKAVGIGAASGAVAGAVATAVPLGLAALGLKAATAGGAAFIGWVGGSLAGGAGQITANLLTPCMKWHQGVSRAMFWGGLGGAAFGWAGWHVRQWWTAARPVNNHSVPYPDVDVPGYGKVSFPKGPYTPNNTHMRPSFNYSYRQQFRAWWTGQGRPWPSGTVNVHHIKPLQFGGTNAFENLVPLEESVHKLFNSWWRNFP